jgi:hypothetical protein
LFVSLLAQQQLGVFRATENAETLGKYADEQRMGLLRPVVPEFRNQFAHARLDHHLWRYAGAQALESAVQDLERRPAEYAVDLPKVTAKTQEADGLSREKMGQWMISAGFGTAQKMGKAFLPTQVSESIGKVDPVPGLFDEIRGLPTLKLAFQNPTGLFRADFGEGSDLNHVLSAWAKAGLDGAPLAPLQQRPEAGFRGFEGTFTQLPALEKLDVLASDGGQDQAGLAPGVQMPCQQERGGHEDRQKHRHDEYHWLQHHFHQRQAVDVNPADCSALTHLTIPDHDVLVAC